MSDYDNNVVILIIIIILLCSGSEKIEDTCKKEDMKNNLM